MITPCSGSKEIVMRGRVQAVEVSLVRRSVPVKRIADHVPHVVVPVNADMRHTLGQITRHFSGTNRTFGHHARIPSP